MSVRTTETQAVEVQIEPPIAPCSDLTDETGDRSEGDN